MAFDAGVFLSECEIGRLVSEADLLGTIARRPLASPCAGRLIGLRDAGVQVAEGETLIEVAFRIGEPWMGAARYDQALARALLFAVQMEKNVWAPVPIDGLL